MISNDLKPSYYAILTADVRYANISSGAKLLYAEITALTSINGVCFASNDYFANLYNVSIRCIQNWLKELQDNKFIEIKIDNSLKRKIFLIARNTTTKENSTANETVKTVLNLFKKNTI